VPNTPLHMENPAIGTEVRKVFIDTPFNAPLYQPIANFILSFAAVSCR
jgi:hypothetical protein